MLAELSPQVQLDPASTDVLVRRPGSRGDAGEIDLALTDRDQILLVPSHFAWPELIAVMQKDLRNGREQRTILILYALAEMQQAGRAPVPPAELLKLLRSAGDPTRLQILQLLARRSRFTREIAGLIGLTEAAISKHLKLLQDAGWVMPERQSYYVYYALVRETSASLSRPWTTYSVNRSESRRFTRSRTADRTPAMSHRSAVPARGLGAQIPWSHEVSVH
jgi:DNA-binding transcriptional ArsR family regulator